MASRTKTQEEKYFNKIASMYGKNAFTANQFDKDKELQKALQSYLNNKQSIDKTFDDEWFGNVDTGYHDFLLDDHEIFQESEYVDAVVTLFHITDRTIAEQIACSFYYDIYTKGFIEIVEEDGSYIEDTSLQNKIDSFLENCKHINNAKKFITEHYPRYSEATREEKSKILKDLESLIIDLKILKIDTKPLQIALHLVKNYQLNQIRKLKRNMLMTLKLPYITDKIALKIVENLKFPYC
jgi:hypothetical protein